MRLLKLLLISFVTSISLNIQAQCYDSTAQAFFTATGITDTAQKNSINHLVLDLKSAGLWTKMKTLYPFVGGTATTHKYNLKDPRDLDAAYRLSFSGTITHSSTGVLSDGSSGYANTHLSPSSALTINSTHLSYYSRTTSTATKIEMGVSDGGANEFIMACNYTGIGAFSTAYVGNSQGRAVATPTNSSGFFIGSRTSSTAHSLYRNGSSLVTNTQTNTGGLPSGSVYLLAWDYENNGAYDFSQRECAFASIGDGLTSTEASTFNTIVSTYLYNLVNGGGGGCGTSGGDSTGCDSNWIRSGNNIYNLNTGNIGIGTSNPTTKLAVNGYISAKKLIVTQTGWADYVFDKAYKLPTMEETERFIKLNQHLPGIPSAKEVEKNGLDVGTNQALLLKKIEELTLIIIEQNKRIKALEEQSKNKIIKLQKQR